MEKTEAIEIAKKIAAELGWTWLEPINAELRKGNWTVISNYSSRGCNVKIEIQDSTRQVVAQAFLPR